MRSCAILLALALAGCGSNGTNPGSDGGSQKDMGQKGGPDLAGAPTVSLSGMVVDNSSGSTPTPLAGATVEVAGAQPANQTTTAADGSFTLMVTQGATLFLRASVANYYPGELGGVVPTGGSSGVQIGLIPNAAVQAVVSSLNPALTLDPNKGAVNVNFHNINKVGGYGASISAAHDNPFTIVNNAGMYSSMTVSGGENTVVFPNVAPGTTTVTITTPAGKTCATQEPITSWRVDPGTFTFVDYQCM